MAKKHKDELDIREPEFENACECQHEQDSGYYRTGSTTPPKDHAGVVAVVLVLLILCSGLITALGLLDIHPFHPAAPAEPRSPMSFSAADGTLPQVLEQPDPAQPEDAQENMGPTCPADAHTDLQLKSSPQGSENMAQEGALSWQQVYEKVLPSVVSITTRTPNTSSNGSGVVMSCEGYIITSAHVVENASSIEVLLTDGRTFGATVVGADGISDLAVLYIEADGLTAAEFGDSDSLRVGDEVVAIGDPLGAELRGTMTEGTISAINRDLKIGGKNMTMLQTTAALNPGNSGGPLINCYGQVIGINTMKIGDYASTSGVKGLGFSVPMTSAKPVVEQLISIGYVSGRPTFGIKGQMLSSFYQYYYRLPVGLLITEVKDRSTAQEAGVQPGDLLLSINGIRITSANKLEELLYGLSVGDKVNTVIYRSGREYEMMLSVEESEK